MRNIPLLVEVMAHIRLYPELHNQTWFFSETDCGTASCFGGWALTLSGHFPLQERECFGASVCTPEGHRRASWSAAQAVLGLTAAEAMVLFAPGNTRAMLDRMVEDLINGNDIARIWDYHDRVPQRA